ncbi:recombinase family protein [Kitasatospora sp. NPDC057940]|uniref:recombinase family protein n=1 Tax=Kitasatospora sp. NPDC057940 TaxID=3346285 RepID=UPI0036DF37DD
MSGSKSLNPRKRALIGVRLSVATEESTSPARQREKGRLMAQMKDYQIVGYAEDLDVSATKFRPIDRPQLGDWMKNRHHEFDVMIFWKLDRIVRSPADLSDMIRWCDEHRKNLIFVDDTFDLSSDLGEAMAYMASVFARMEARKISARVADAHRYLKGTRRWAGGRPPYGYRIVPLDGGGKVLEIDPVTSAIVRQMYHWAIAGVAQWEMARRLNRQEVPTPRNWIRLQNSLPVTPAQWNPASIGKILTSPACTGLKMTGGSTGFRRIVYDTQGNPVRAADAILSPDEWQLLQAVLGAARPTRKRRVSEPYPYLGSVFCAQCGNVAYRQVNRIGETGYGYYRCGAPPGNSAKRCDTASPMEFVEEQFKAIVTHLFSTVQAVEPIPLDASLVHGETIVSISRAMNDIRTEKDMGLYEYEGGNEEYLRRINGLAERRRVVAKSVLPSPRAMRPTGSTIASEWAGSDVAGQRQLLLKSKVKAYMCKSALSFVFPDDLRKELASV